MTVASAGADEGSLIKIGRMGRMRFTREQREKILDAYEASGSSGTDFAKIHGIKYQTLATWVQRRRRERRLMQDAVDAAGPELRALDASLRSPLFPFDEFAFGELQKEVAVVPAVLGAGCRGGLPFPAHGGQAELFEVVLEQHPVAFCAHATSSFPLSPSSRDR